MRNCRCILRTALLCGFTAACGTTKSKPGETMLSSTASAAPPSQSAAPVAPVASVVVDSRGVWLDGARVGDVAPDASASAANLRGQLAARRASSESHQDDPNDGLPASLAIAFSEDASCSTALGLVESARLAGYRNLTLDVGGGAHSLLVSRAGPSTNLPPSERSRGAHLSFLKNGSVEVRFDACLTPYDVVPAARVGEVLKAIAEGRLGAVAVQCDTGVLLRDVVSAFDLAALTAAGSDLNAPSAGLYAEPGCESSQALDDWDTTWGPAPALLEPIPVPAGSRLRVRFGAPHVSGGTDGYAGDVLLRAESRRDKLAQCFAAGVKSTPTLAGAVAISMLLGKKGTVAAFTETAASLPDRGVVSCVRHELGSLVFKPPTSPVTRVTVQMAFLPD